MILAFKSIIYLFFNSSVVLVSVSCLCVSCRVSLKTLALTSVLCGCSSLKCVRKTLTGTTRSPSAWWKSTTRHFGEQNRHEWSCSVTAGGRDDDDDDDDDALQERFQCDVLITAAYSALFY